MDFRLMRLAVIGTPPRFEASDYDDWETNCDNPGWGSKDLVPLLRKVRKSMLKTDI